MTYDFRDSISNFSPIIIFCYRRKIDPLIISLLRNREASESDLFIFSDNYKSDIDKKDVIEVRKSLKRIKGFKSITIHEANYNKGLAESIIGGVTLIIKRFKKAIILEDDLVISKHFLNYMNKSLFHFEERDDIWSISGYGPPLLFPKNQKSELYLSLRSSSWGWATWLNRWEKANWSINDFLNLKTNKSLIQRFEEGGSDLYKMLELQYMRKIDSWAIRWCYSQFLNNAFSVTPCKSMTRHDGFGDKVGTHNIRRQKRWDVQLDDNEIKNFDVIYDEEIVKKFKEHHDLRLTNRLSYLLRKYDLYDIVYKLIKSR